MPQAHKGIRNVNNISASGVIYKESDPRNVFLEVKDDGYPVKAFRGFYCLFGGNWIGEAARSDRGPRDTFAREASEELSLDRETMSTEEAVQLGDAQEAAEYKVSPTLVVPTTAARKRLEDVKAAIRELAVSITDNVNTTPKAVLDRLDPENKRSTQTGLNCLFGVGLPDGEWNDLAELQKTYGNLSQESASRITTLAEIISEPGRFSWGYDRILQHFFLECGLREANAMTLIEGIEVEFLGRGLASYEEYLKHFDVAKRPQ